VTNPKPPTNNKMVEDYKTPTYGYNDNSGHGERTVMMVSSTDDLPVSKSVRTHPVPPPPMSSSPVPSSVAPQIGAPASSPAQLHHMNSLGRAPSGSIPASGSSGSFGGAQVPAPVRTSMPAARSGSGSLGVAAVAGGAAVAGAGAAALAAGSGSRSGGAPAAAAAPPSPRMLPEAREPAGPVDVSGGSGSGWATNVRPAAPAAAAAAAAGAAGAGAAAAATSANPQQAERAKFWAQFNDTWQQVRATKEQQRDGDEPGTPSSGTNWTETDFGSPTSKR
jgi:hypothetical protein